jgi:hypothetical protein
VKAKSWCQPTVEKRGYESKGIFQLIGLPFLRHWEKELPVTGTIMTVDLTDWSLGWAIVHSQDLMLDPALILLIVFFFFFGKKNSFFKKIVRRFDIRGVCTEVCQCHVIEF